MLYRVFEPQGSKEVNSSNSQDSTKDELLKGRFVKIKLKKQNYIGMPVAAVFISDITSKVQS